MYLIFKHPNDMNIQFIQVQTYIHIYTRSTCIHIHTEVHTYMRFPPVLLWSEVSVVMMCTYLQGVVLSHNASKTARNWVRVNFSKSDYAECLPARQGVRMQRTKGILMNPKRSPVPMPMKVQKLGHGTVIKSFLSSRIRASQSDQMCF